MNAEECWANFFWAVALSAILCTLIVNVSGCQKDHNKLMIDSGHSYNGRDGWTAPSPGKPRIIFGPTVERPLPEK